MLWRKAGRGRGITWRRVALFVVGILVLVLALMSPIDTLGEQFLSMHMVQHELLMVVAAPLFVLSRPIEAWAWALPRDWRSAAGTITRSSPVRAPWSMLTRPLTACLLQGAILWLWHAPALFDAALASEAIHTAQHMSFLATALLFWWTALGFAHRRAANGVSLVYLFATMLNTEALGALLVFSSTPLYSAYAALVDRGLDPIQDQQLAGLIMWVPGGLPYLAAAVVVGYLWLSPKLNGSPSTDSGGARQ